MNRWEQLVAEGRKIMAKAMDEVKQPGLRGGKGYRTESGKWRYGAKGPGRPTPGRGLEGLDSDEAQDRIGNDLDARLRAKMKGLGNSDDSRIANAAAFKQRLQDNHSSCPNCKQTVCNDKCDGKECKGFSRGHKSNHRPPTGYIADTCSAQ